MSDDVPVDRGRISGLAPILFFDVLGPLGAYYALSVVGASSVLALVLSGVLPAFGIVLYALRRRRVDAVGVVVLIGILLATAVSLASGSARVALLDGTVPTAVFAVACLGSLWSRRPLMLRFAMEAMGADTPRGRAFADRWRYPAFRRTFR
ncbi:MAG: hypothetical protein M3Y35_13865, partial [Actinomycetota bacterium]|nr:hypothetical protein [Actinomycetota bacterium]